MRSGFGTLLAPNGRRLHVADHGAFGAVTRLEHHAQVALRSVLDDGRAVSTVVISEMNRDDGRCTFETAVIDTDHDIDVLAQHHAPQLAVLTHTTLVTELCRRSGASATLQVGDRLDAALRGAYELPPITLTGGAGLAAQLTACGYDAAAVRAAIP